MKFFKKIREQLEENLAATMNSQALLEELDRTEPEVEQQHVAALSQLNESETQARRLKAGDRRNHYSEGLTYSMRGNTA